MSGRRSGGGVDPLTAMLLMSQLSTIIDRYGIPAVTGVFSAFMLFLHYIPIDETFHAVFGYPMTFDNICLKPGFIIYGHQYSRLILGQLFHLGDRHVLYNLVSFLMKGVYLERRFPVHVYSWLVVLLTILTGLMTTFLSFVWSFTSPDSDPLTACHVGFSGVVFALKVITIHSGGYSDHEDFFGLFRVPSKYAYWAELVVIHLLVPNSSFIGHLAGICVGIAFVKGMLYPLVDAPAAVVKSFLDSRKQYSRGGNGRFTGGGVSGYRD